MSIDACSHKKRLKQVAEQRRVGVGADAAQWVLKDGHRLPPLDELTTMCTPEMMCAHYTMMASEQRLKDAGYGERHLALDADNDDEVTIEAEVKCAPWNTTHAYLSAVRNKCVLDTTGLADPTGPRQEAFSYVRVSTRRHGDEKAAAAAAPATGAAATAARINDGAGGGMPKKLVTGTSADLRKLPLKDAKQMLREFNVPENEVTV